MLLTLNDPKDDGPTTRYVITKINPDGSLDVRYIDSPDNILTDLKWIRPIQSDDALARHHNMFASELYRDDKNLWETDMGDVINVNLGAWNIASREEYARRNLNI